MPVVYKSLRYVHATLHGQMTVLTFDLCQQSVHLKLPCAAGTQKGLNRGHVSTAMSFSCSKQNLLAEIVKFSRIGSFL